MTSSPHPIRFIGSSLFGVASGGSFFVFAEDGAFGGALSYPKHTLSYGFVPAYRNGVLGGGGATGVGGGGGEGVGVGAGGADRTTTTRARLLLIATVRVPK